MSEPTVEVRRASEIDLGSYAAFQRRAFRDLLIRNRAGDAHMTPETYRWKYNPPGGEARIARVVVAGETVSTSAAMPLRVVFSGDSVIGWHCVDVATLPKARRRGHFLAALRALAAAVPAGEVVFAYPNAGSIDSFLKIGCVENAILTIWFCPCARLIRRSDPRIGEAVRFGPEHESAGVPAAGGRPMLDRSSAYLNWRYTDHPGTDYTSFVLAGDGCEGLCVVRRARILDRDIALVMEVLGRTPSLKGRLLAQAAAWAHANGLGALAVMSTSLPTATATRRLFVPIPTVLLPKRQVLVVGGTGEAVDRLKNRRWAVQTGDWDVF